MTYTASFRDDRPSSRGMGSGAKWVLCLMLMALCLALSGCPDTNIGDTPPFDTTGTYQGTYSTGEEKQFFGAEDCFIELELVQFVQQPAIAYTFAGIARLEWDCILPAAVRSSLGIESEMLVSPVLATLDNDGGFSLDLDLDGSNVPPALRQALDDSEVDPDLPLTSFSLEFNGMGTDLDLDGFMDECAGTLALMATYEDDGAQTIDLGGSFSATAVAPGS